MKISLFYLPSVGNKAEIEKGMIGLRGEFYDQMLHDVSEQAKLADGLGYDSISFTEHHFHAEGFELSNNPVLLDLYIAMQTKRIRVGQLGIVLPANNPIRVAEDIAMLDHMSGGRANAGYARGYQRRRVDIMAQQTHGIHGAHPHEHDEIDAANRAAFEECFRIIKAAWTQDMLSYQGKYWRIPPGETPWPIEATVKWGRGVENGIVKAVSVVPKPVQKPHPPILIGGAGDRVLRIVAEHADIWNYPGPPSAEFRRKDQVLAEHCAAIGRDPGEILRSMQTVVRCDDPQAPAATRALLLEMIDAGVTHLVIAPVLAGRSPQWLADQIIEPVLAEAARR